MKNFLLTCVCLVALKGAGQGFPNSSINWNAPNGGKISGSITYGFNNIGGTAFSFDGTGSQTWAIMDMNGDKRPDLIVAAQLQAGNVTCFSPGSNQYWNVYLNNGNGYAATSTQWALPNGGRMSGGTTYGFDNLYGTASSSDNTGSQTWTVSDFNGDGKPDLVVTAQLQAGNVTSFSPASGQYWKVYLNTGSGFSSSATNWNLPNGGKISGGTTYGFNNSGGSAVSNEDTGSQTWSLVDLNGDSKPDLVVAAQLQAGNVTSFSPASGQYWKVYLNNGSGFAATGLNWNLPNGGKLSGNTTFGFQALSGTAFSSDDTGSQSWSVMDIDGDGKPDLIITAQLQAGNVTSFSPVSNQYWKVYTNNSTGFAASPSNWDLPNGGRINGGVTYGFNSISGSANSSDDTGSQNWALMDLDGHPEPELIVTAQLQAGDVTSFSPGNNQYWKVFRNTNSGFSPTILNCSLPVGGKLSGGVTYGFNNIGGVASSSDDTGSQSWGVVDMDGDNIPDLVIAGQLQAGNVTSFSPTSNQYWKVYKSNFVTGIKENSFNAQTFNLFPNPNNGSFIIQSSIQEKLTVINEVGQVIQTLELNQLNNFSSQISGLQNGVYFVAGKNSASKIVIIN